MRVIMNKSFFLSVPPTACSVVKKDLNPSTYAHIHNSMQQVYTSSFGPVERLPGKCWKAQSQQVNLILLVWYHTSQFREGGCERLGSHMFWWVDMECHEADCSVLVVRVPPQWGWVAATWNWHLQYSESPSPHFCTELLHDSSWLKKGKYGVVAAMPAWENSACSPATATHG